MKGSVVQSTDLGQLNKTTIEEYLHSPPVGWAPQLVFTSPPFAPGPDYGVQLEDWFSGLACEIVPGGSLVVVLGNCWRDGRQTRETLEALMDITRFSGMQLVQQFVTYFAEPQLSASVRDEMYPRMLSKGDRVPDIHGHAWWLAHPGQEPKVNRRALQRSVVPAALSTEDHRWRDACWRNDLKPPHSAMPESLPDYFIQLLTDEGDMVLDPFAGSNATGVAAERSGREWLSIEPDDDALAVAKLRLEGSLDE